MDDSTTAGTPAPDRSPVLARRVAAGLVDLTFVCLTAAATALLTSTRVPALRRPDGSVTFGDADRELLGGLTGPLSGGRFLGDTLWAFSTVDVLTVGAATVAAGIAVGALVPQLADDRSPGKLLFRLRVATLDGRPPGPIRHLARTLASPFDLMPLVVPGLTGYAFAASNPAQQRIGDRLAGTIVIDRQSSEVNVPVAAAIVPRARPRDRRPGGVVPAIRSATLVVDAPARTDATLNTDTQPPDLDGDKVARPYPVPVRPSATPADRERSRPEPQPDGDTADMNERDGAPDGASRQSTPESTAAPIPVEERSNNPYPKPVRRSREVTEEPQLTDFDSLTLPESSLSDMPLTKDALFEALGLTPPSDNAAEPTEPARPTERTEPTTPTERTEPTRAAVAPSAATTTVPAPVARQGSSPAPNKRAPIWSEDWDAWIYWDTTLQTWFRHDKAHGTWLPMDED